MMTLSDERSGGTMKLSINTRLTLNNGVKIPLLGFGTWDVTGSGGRQAVLWALEAGYRLVDTASSYGNENEVGEAVRASGTPREEIFITSKVWPTDFGYETTLRAFEASRRRLGLDRLDLYLIHWPGENRKRRAEAWRALETLLKDGLCRAIGVSNYSVEDLKEILAARSVIPAVNQVPFSPFSQQREVHDFCASRGIRVEAYSPLTRGRRLSDRGLRSVAKSYGRTPAQIMLRWAVQKEVIVIPKSIHRERIRENAQIFDFSISRADMAALDALEE
jgi:diketogulonate reductase-like aldo/keto reductase